MLALVRRLAELREELPALQTGAQKTLEAGPGVLAWLRGGADDRLLAAVNFAPEAVALQVEGVLPARAGLLLSTDPDRACGVVEPGALVLGPAEGVLLRP
jgi:alpha-glucosidase